jgi:hypothetical protein
MASDRTEKMGGRTGLMGFIDSLRFHEASRQGGGFILLLITAWFAEPAGENRIFIGFALAAIGQIWRIYAAGVIFKNRKLATTGAYSLVRHPLYTGNFLILLGFTIACANLPVVILVVAFFLFYYPAAVRYEDHKLEGIFGDEWRAWSSTKPALIPRSLKWESNQDASWNMRQSMIRNGELFYTLFEIGAAALLWYRATL